MGRHIEHIDWIAVATLFAIGVFGLFLLISIDQSLFVQQAVFMVVGFVLLFLCSRINHLVLHWFAPIGYLLGSLFLALSYFGPAIRGATRWIIIGGVQLQPSELAKPIFLLAFAWAIAKYPPRTFRNTLINVGLFLPPFLLVFRQPDLGTSLVYLGSWLTMMIGGGFPLVALLGIGAAGFFSTPVIWRFLHEYQKQRVLTFLDPALDPKGAGYNALQAMIAVGSGQLFGRGLGRGTQSHLRFLPEFHTDFIFATLVEELGFIGGAILILAYVLLLLRIVLPLLGRLRDHIFPFVYSLGLFAMLLTQITINTGMNMGMIPITGITLPFVSYGGSSILSIAIAFGILWAIGNYPDETRIVAIR